MAGGGSTGQPVAASPFGPNSSFGNAGQQPQQNPFGQNSSSGNVGQPPQPGSQFLGGMSYEQARGTPVPDPFATMQGYPSQLGRMPQQSQQMSLDQFSNQPRNFAPPQQYMSWDQFRSRQRREPGDSAPTQEDYQRYLQSGSGGIMPSQLNPFGQQLGQPAYMQTPEFQGYQKQQEDLSRQMNDYMQQSPLYKQMQDLQGKMRSYVQPYEQQQQAAQYQQAQRAAQYQQQYNPYPQYQQPMGGLASLFQQFGQRQQMQNPYARQQYQPYMRPQQEMPYNVPQYAQPKQYMTMDQMRADPRYQQQIMMGIDPNTGGDMLGINYDSSGKFTGGAAQPLSPQSMG